MTADEQRELAQMLAEMGYDRATRTWKAPPVDRRKQLLKIGKNIVMAGASVGAAYLLTSVMPGPPHLPVSLVPFYLGVALATRLGCRKTGWYAWIMALPAFYMDENVACLPWLTLAVVTLAVIASIGTRDRPGRGPARRPLSPPQSQPLPSGPADGPLAALFGLPTGA